MSYSPLSGAPQATPEVIKKLLFITCIASVGCGLLDSILGQLYEGISFQYLLSLSREGVHNLYIWQILTYMFIQATSGFGLSIYFFLNLAFSMYLLWTIGSSLVEYVGERAFLRFYLLIGLLTGIIVWITLYYLPNNQVYSGPLPSILALILVASMVYPEVELLILFLFTIKAKWLAVVIGSVAILLPLSRLDTVNLVFNVSGIILGYIYAVMAWKLRSPFPITYKADNLLQRTGNILLKQGSQALQSTKKFGNSAKIFDFNTGERILSDDEFVDAMLAKISKKGESSLSFSERRRLDEISQKKQKK